MYIFIEYRGIKNGSASDYPVPWNNNSHRSSIISLVYVGKEGVRLPSQYGEMGKEIVILIFWKMSEKNVVWCSL